MINKYIVCFFKNKRFTLKYGVIWGFMENFTISSDLIRGHIDTIILKSLFDGDKHAHEISGYIEEKSGNTYEVKQATLYSALKRLENQKAVKAYWQDAPEGGRRRYFNLTDKGRNQAEKQLSEWGFSRDVIDKLVDEIVLERVNIPYSQIKDANKTEELVEKEATVIKEVENPTVIDKKTELDVIKENNVKNEETVINKPIEKTEIEVKPVSLSESLSEKTEVYSQSRNKFDEINYKSVLNNLFTNIPDEDSTPEIKIKTTTSNLKSEQPDIFVKRQVVTENPVQPKVQNYYSKDNDDDVIDIKNIDRQTFIKPHKIGRVDFTDLIEQANNEGFKIRISSKKSQKRNGLTLINKVNLFSAMSTFLVLMLEMLGIVLLSNNAINGLIYLFATLIFIVFPIKKFIDFKNEPDLAISDYNKSTVGTVLIVVFNVILVVLAINLLVGSDFNNNFDLLFKILSPILLALDVCFYYLFRNFFAKSKSCLTK